MKIPIKIFVFIAWPWICGFSQMNYPQPSLTIEDGLPKSQIYDIIQDANRYLWIGTRDGKVKYDGHRVELYRSGFNGLSLKNPSGNSFADVRALQADPLHPGVYWIGVEGGVLKYTVREEKLEVILRGEPWFIEYIYVHSDNKAAIWIALAETGELWR